MIKLDKAAKIRMILKCKNNKLCSICRDWLKRIEKELEDEKIG
jgi:hypothetical protein